jgi:hypothetical protein
VVGISFRVVIIQDCIRDAASSESIFDVDWNAVWQLAGDSLVMCLVVAAWGSGWGFNFLVVALAPAHVTCESQQAPFAALVNGFENGRAGVVVAECHCFTQAGLSDMSLQYDGHRPHHRTGDMRQAFHLFVSV